MGPLLYIKLMNASSKAGGGGGPTKPSGHTPNPLPAILNPRMIIIFIILMAFQYIQHVTYVYLAYKFGFLGNG